MAVGSIVDYLNSTGQNSSYAARKNLAAANGITNYTGTAKQNTDLLSKLQSGTASSGSSATATTPTPSAAVTQGIETITDNTPGYTAPGSVGYAKYSGATTSNNYKKSDTVNSLYNKAQNYADNVADMEYEMSDRVKGYQNKLADIENSKPAAFQSKYTDQINTLLDQILNEKEFSYTGSDMMNDDLYKAMSDQYEHNARKAMQNAMGNAQAQTGGYGSTYSQAAGQQAYDETMSNMNDIALELADRAYQKYTDNRANRYNQMATVTGLDNTDYSRYRDDVSDWQTDRSYYAGRYDNEYAQDYGAYRDSVSDAQNTRDYYANLYGTEYTNDLAAHNSDLAASQWEQEYELSKVQDARDAEKWALEKQQLELALQQAQLEAAGLTSGSGSSGGSSSSGRKSSSRKSSSKSSSSGSSSTGTLVTLDQVEQLFNDKSVSNQTVKDAISMVRSVSNAGPNKAKLDSLERRLSTRNTSK